MAYRLLLVPRLNLGIIRMSETITGAEIAQAGSDLYHLPAWQPGFDEVWDLLDVTSIIVSPEELRQVVSLEKQFSHLLGPARTVLMTRRPAVQIIMQSFAVMLRFTKRPMYIVRSPQEAARKLEQPDLLAYFTDDAP